MPSLYIFDLDGTLFRGHVPTPGAVETLAGLRKRGAQIRFLTNNAGHDNAFYREKLQKIGFEVFEGEVYSTPQAAAAYCIEENFRRVFLIGQPGLVSTLRAKNIEVLNAGVDGELDIAKTLEFQAEGEADALILGFCRIFDYELLAAGMQVILRGAKFLLTNGDLTYPLEQGKTIPGTGSLGASLQACTGVKPHILGKPNPFLIEMILRDAGCPPEDALVVGDRVDTDLEAGRRAGCPTHLVLCGVTKHAPEHQSFSNDLTSLLN